MFICLHLSVYLVIFRFKLSKSFRGLAVATGHYTRLFSKYCFFQCVYDLQEHKLKTMSLADQERNSIKQ